MTQLSSPTISIRTATADDGRTLVRLAGLDSAQVPFGPVILAEVDGEPRAAMSLRDGGVIADPFFRTAELVSLLRVHADAIGSREPSLAGALAGGFARRLRFAA